MNLASKILAIRLKEETIAVPEWDATIGIREMNVEQRLRFAEDAKKWPAVAMVRLLVTCAFDPETSKPLFDQAHHDSLLQQPGAVVDRIVTEICRISGLGTAESEAAEKN